VEIRDTEAGRKEPVEKVSKIGLLVRQAKLGYSGKQQRGGGREKRDGEY
jgi:hypothetical protein